MPNTQVKMDPVLSKRMLSAINGALHKIDAAFQECELAESCNNSCTDKREYLDSAREQLNLYKAFYFPEAK